MIFFLIDEIQPHEYAYRHGRRFAVRSVGCDNPNRLHVITYHKTHAGARMDGIDMAIRYSDMDMNVTLIDRIEEHIIFCDETH